MAKSDKRIDSLPILSNPDEFEEWKRDIAIWKAVTTVEKKTQGPILYRSLEGQAKKACSNIKIEDICSDRGYDLIIEKLTQVFAKDNEQKAFEDCRKFEIFQRSSDMNIVQYITEFERLYDKLQIHDMKYADAVLAYKLLINANISEEKQSMCRATMGKLTFDNIKRQLKVIHDSTGTDEQSGTLNSGNVTVKEEPVFEAEYSYTDNFFGQSRDRGRWRGNRRPNMRGNYRGNYGFRTNASRKTGNEQEAGRTEKPGKKTNPLDRWGNITVCSICRSIYHWARDCPDKEPGYEEKINLFANGVQGTYLPQFLQETLNCAILDCGCVKTVCGKKWLDVYVQSLSSKEKEEMSETYSDTRFRFGVGGPVYTSEKRITLPAVLGKKNVSIETDVIDCDLPLLLSKESMKKAETEIHFRDDEVSMLGQNLKLHFTSSGHYSVPLGRDLTSENKIEQTFLEIEELDRDNKLKACRKLHTQFGHAASNRLKDLLKDAKVTDKEIFDMIEEVGEKCEICTKFKRPKLRPVVGLALAKEFNDMVSMDLKFYHSVPWLHMIDHSTRFSSACVIPDKKQETIIEHVFKHWISIFGSPKNILSDNGCEFNNSAMRELGELLNVQVRTTAAESPWSNGITERHNALIGSMLDKIIEEQNCSLELALAWAVNAKNSLSNVYGYSPYQLVFGKNPNIPGALTDKLPALESVTSSQILADHLNAITTARKAYVEAEASNKVKRALTRKVRPATSLIYDTGDKVFYKRNQSDKWRGPATVIGKEKHQVFIKHGGVYLRVNPCHLTHVNDELTFSNEDSKKKEEAKKLNEQGTMESGYVSKEAPNLNVEEDSDEEAERKEKETHNLNDEEDSDEEGREHSRHVVARNTSDNNEIYSQIANEPNHQPERDANSTNPKAAPGTCEPVMPSKGSKIRYKLRDSEDVKEAKVLGKAGKATGKNKFWINIEDENGQLKSLNVEQLSDMQIVEDLVLLSCNESDVEVKQAMALEIENWKNHNVFTEVEDEGQTAVSSRWVITEKYKEGVKCVKARLVARGFEEADIGEIRKDSPTCGKESLRLCLTLFASMNWKINSLDIKAAFLQGNPIEREVYIMPPKEVQTNKLWKLNKTVYGLADASRTWYLRVRQELTTLGIKVSKYDEAVFFLEHRQRSRGSSLLSRR